MHVVVFPGWYPNRHDHYSGDFIQRHMHAIALYCKVTVVIPVKDTAIKKAEVVVKTKNNLTEIYHYYPSVGGRRLAVAVSFLKYNYYAVKHLVAAHKAQKVSLVHLYVLQKNYLLGWLSKLLTNNFYVVSEQSTAYVDGQYEHFSIARKYLTRKVFAHARSYHAVSEFLLNNIRKKLHMPGEGVVIGNVVDADAFTFNPKQNHVTQFVHVSNMTHQKNIDGMLQALALLKTRTQNFNLQLVGPANDVVLALIASLQLQQNVTVCNERPYTEVATIMKQSDAFIFFTRFETFGCVIIEANACGLPVVVSDLPVTRELITDHENGLFVQNENVNDLADKLLYFIDNKTGFNGHAISLQTRERFNYNTVGKQFIEWYGTVLNKQ